MIFQESTYCRSTICKLLSLHTVQQPIEKTKPSAKYKDQTLAYRFKVNLHIKSKPTE